MITDNQEYIYINSNGATCPHCNNEDLQGLVSFFDGYNHYTNMVCNECNSTWTDIYKLSAISDFKLGGL